MGTPKLLSTPGSDAYEFPLLIRHLLSALPQHRQQEIVSGERRFSYEEFADRVNRLAALLAARGVEAGDTVAVMDWDSHRYLECFFAVPMMGAVLQTVNVRLSAQQIAFTLNQTRPAIVLRHSDFSELWGEITPLLSEVPPLLALSDADGQSEYEVLIEATAPAFCFQDFDERAIATTFHTTGTTGDPKQVFFSHRQLVLHTLALGAALANQPDGQGMRRSDVYMPITPMFHVHAWGMPYLATMLGLKQVYPGRYEPEKLIALKMREGVTFSHCVPTIVRMLIDEARRREVHLAPWAMVIGGSALPPALAEEAAGVGILAVAGYGMSETGPVVTLSRTVDDMDPALRCRGGFPIPLVYLRTATDGGNELQLRAPWLTQGYGTQEASDALWEGGWLHTGDVASLDEDDAVRITDRLKDVIKTGGEWVSSLEIEALLMEHPAVLEASVIGVPDAKWGERPVAFVKAAQDISPDAMTSHLSAYVEAGKISRFAVPDHFHLIPDLPRTSVGKIDKVALRRKAALMSVTPGG